MLREDGSPRDIAPPGRAPGRSAETLYARLLAELWRAEALPPAADATSHAFEDASGVVATLQSTLVHQPSAEVAARLSALYAYFSTELDTLARTPDAHRLARLIRMVEGLSDAAARRAAAEATPEPAGPQRATVLRRPPDTV